MLLFAQLSSILKNWNAISKYPVSFHFGVETHEFGVFCFCSSLTASGITLTNSVIRCFADDTRIMKAITLNLDMAILQQDLNEVIDSWANNSMSLHEDKFEYMCHSANRSNALQHLPMRFINIQPPRLFCSQLSFLKTYEWLLVWISAGLHR